MGTGPATHHSVRYHVTTSCVPSRIRGLDLALDYTFLPCAALGIPTHPQSTRSLFLAAIPYANTPLGTHDSYLRGLSFGPITSSSPCLACPHAVQIAPVFTTVSVSRPTRVLSLPERSCQFLLPGSTVCCPSHVLSVGKLIHASRFLHMFGHKTLCDSLLHHAT